MQLFVSSTSIWSVLIITANYLHKGHEPEGRMPSDTVFLRKPTLICARKSKIRRKKRKTPNDYVDERYYTQYLPSTNYENRTSRSLMRAYIWEYFLPANTKCSNILTCFVYLTILFAPLIHIVSFMQVLLLAVLLPTFLSLTISSKFKIHSEIYSPQTGM